MNSTISILGLYNADPSLFDEMQLPEAIDRETVVNGILLKCSELEILYPEPAYMKNAIRIWSAYRVTVWQSLYDTTQYDYNPIWNKDGTVTETERRNKDGTATETKSRNTSSSASGSGTGQQAVKAFNESNWADHTKNTSTSKADSKETEGITSEAASNETEGITRERREKGNIGVTTTQQMIKEEREISEFNVIQYIIDDFQNEFCVQIY